MSAGYGYCHISIVNNDGSANEQKAKEAYEYCMKTYEWFSNEEPFVLEGTEINTNYDVYPDGFDAKHGDIPTDDYDWLCDVQNELGIERIVAEINTDFSESSIEENYNTQLLIENGEIVKERTVQHCFTDDIYGEVDTSCYYLLNDFLMHYRAKFKNKNTGKIVLGGLIQVCPGEDYDSVLDAIFDGKYNLKIFTTNDVIDLLDKDGNPITWIGNFDHFADEYNILEGFDFFDDSKDDWEFTGFGTQNNFFDVYAKKPQDEDYEIID